MKLSAILAIAICLASAKQAISEPAEPILRILSDIQAQLPPGMVMRLPTQTAVDGVQDALYATVEPIGSGGIRVDLGSAPNCTVRACMRGYFSSTPAEVEHPMDESIQTTAIGTAPITLADGIVGNFITLDGAGRPFSIVRWQQDEQTYVVSVIPDPYPLLEGMTQQQSARQRILDFALSMATETPLTKE